MPIYRRKPTTVDAEQFTDIANPPRGVTLGHLSGMHEVVTLQGVKVGVRIGEWIVREPSNAERFYPIADDEFRRIYETKLSDGKGEAENTDKVIHVFKREGAGMFVPQDVVSITAQGGLTICVAGHCITKRPEDWHAMSASVAPATDTTDMRMDAYYYGFELTGIAYIDKILSAVACAGKAYHHTNEWQDEASPYPYHDGKTPQEWIQNAANEAADICRKLTGI